MRYTIVTETSRLILRYFTLDDLDDLTLILADAEVMQFSLNGVKTRLQTEEFLYWILNCYQKYHFGLYAIINRSDKLLIGFCGLLVWHFEEQIEIEIAYRLARAYWGKGRGTEAAIAVRDYARNILSIERLICLIQSENMRSIRVAQKLGMHYEKNIVLQGLNVRIYSSSSS